MIRFEEVSKEYARGEMGVVRALDRFSAEVGEGECLCLIGPSGSGKTTALRTVNRLITPTDGRVLVEGEDVSVLDPIALRRRIGYVIQGAGLFPHMSVAGNVGLLPRLEGWKAPSIAARVDELLELFHLPPEDYRDRFPAELSGGQAQRVALARALSLDPPILLMDEPFGALDPITRREVREEFEDTGKRLRKTVLLVTHDLDEAFRLGDRIALMRSGRVVQAGTPADVRATPLEAWVEEFVSERENGA